MRAAIAVFATLALMTAPATTLAQEAATEEYSVTVSEQRAEITIPEEFDDRSGETSLVFDTHEGRLATAFGFDEADDAQSELDVGLHQLVEYVDENDNGHFDADDEVASAWRISEGSQNLTADSNGTLAWDDLETENVTSDDGVEGTLITGQAAFPSDGPLAGVVEQLGQAENRTFQVNLTVFGQPATVDGAELDASEVDVEWTVDNYPYQREDTSLALVADANSSLPVTVTQDENRSAVGVTDTLADFGVGLAASFDEQAEVDGNETQPSLDELELEDAEATAFAVSYDGGSEVVHGTQTGSSVSQPDSVIGSATDEVSSVPGLTAWAAIGVIAAAAGLIRRR